MTDTSISGGFSSATLTAFFDDTEDAERAVERLRALGLGEVSLTEGGLEPTEQASEPRGFWERLGDFFFPEEDRHTFAEGLSRGGCLVTVTGLDPDDYASAMDALEEAGAVDIEERAESWRAEGWTGYSGADSGMARVETGAAGISSDGLGTAGIAAEGSLSEDGRPRMRGDDNGETIPIVEERLRVGKRDTSFGRVRVRAYVVEDPVSESVLLREERVDIERRPVDRPVQAGDDLFRDRTIEAEESREEPVVQKEARVIEEVGLRKRTETREETVSDTVRHTEVEVEDDREGMSGGVGLGQSPGASVRPASEVEVESGLTDDSTDEALERRNRPT